MEGTIQAVINSITWPTAFAIVGSVVAIVTGLFGYLIKTYSPDKEDRSSAAHKHDNYEQTNQLIHDRVSQLKNEVSQLQVDINVLREKLDSLDRLTTTAAVRDEHDFRQINLKIEKMSDIIMRILTDEKL